VGEAVIGPPKLIDRLSGEAVFNDGDRCVIGHVLAKIPGGVELEEAEERFWQGRIGSVRAVSRDHERNGIFLVIAHLRMSIEDLGKVRRHDVAAVRVEVRWGIVALFAADALTVRKNRDRLCGFGRS